MEIFCCECKKLVKTSIKRGNEVYNNRDDLKELRFRQCNECKNFVGTHKQKYKGIKYYPLGVIANKELKNARRHIHDILDPLFGYYITQRTGKIGSPLFSRRKIYYYLSDVLKKEYHTAEIRSIEEARDVYRIIKDISRNINKYQKIIGAYR